MSQSRQPGRDPDVVIIGGGISGLTAAFELDLAGVSFVLLEKEHDLGGLVGTRSEGDFVVDQGPDAILRDKPDGLELVRLLGLEDEIIPTDPENNRVFVLRSGKLVVLPQGMRLTVPTQTLPMLRSPLFTWRGRARMLAERLVPAARDIGEESIASFVRRRFGAEALERVGEPLLAGIHCGHADRLSMTELFPRLVELEKRYGSLTRAFRAQPARSTSMFFSFRSGMGTLVERLRRSLPSAAIRERTTVTSIDKAGMEIVVRLGQGQPIRPKAVLLAVSLAQAGGLVADLSSGLARSLEDFSFESTVIAFHAYESKYVAHPMNGYGFVVPAAESSRLLAATFVSSKFYSRAPEGHRLVRLFLGGHRDPEIGSMSDSELAELSHRELERAIGPCGDSVMTRIVRWPRRTPQVELGHAARISRVERQLEGLPGIYLIANGFRAVGIPDCIAQARSEARKIAAALMD